MACGKLNPAYSLLFHDGAAKDASSNRKPTNKMQNYCKTIGALAAASALVAGNAQAGTITTTPAPMPPPAPAIEYELHTGYSSAYLYRGLNLGQDLIEVGADVKMNLSGFNLSAGAWYGTVNGANFDGLHLPFDLTMSELDLYVEVAKDFGPVTGSVGYIYRGYNLDPIVGDVNTGEVYFGLSHDFGFVEAALTYYWGVDGVDIHGFTPGTTDGYTELGLRRSFDLGTCLKLNVSTNVGYLWEDSEFTAWTSKVSLDWGFVEHAKLSPFIAASVGLGEAGGTIWYSTTNQLVGGCMLSVNF